MKETVKIIPSTIIALANLETSKKGLCSRSKTLCEINKIKINTWGTTKKHISTSLVREIPSLFCNVRKTS
jgi:hypothetical protein